MSPRPDNIFASIIASVDNNGGHGNRKATKFRPSERYFVTPKHGI